MSADKKTDSFLIRVHLRQAASSVFYSSYPDWVAHRPVLGYNFPSVTDLNKQHQPGPPAGLFRPIKTSRKDR